MTLDQLPPTTYRERCTPVLETERLVLRAPHLVDAKSIAALANDRRIAEMTVRMPHPYGVADAEGFLAAINRASDEMVFLITLPNDTPIGMCGLMRLPDAPEIGYWLGAPFWGKGFATEAVRALIDHAFHDLGHTALDAGARVNNPASRRVLEKCGFQWTGVGLYRIRAMGGSAPVDRFRLDRGIWASLRSWTGAKRVA
jgi:RimJ/RimL family protein N-acetyltransferase